MKTRLILRWALGGMLVAAVAASLWQSGVILRTRGEMARLRTAVAAMRTEIRSDGADLQSFSPRKTVDAATARLTDATGGDVSPTMNESIHAFLRRIEAAKRWFDANPNHRIPEMRYLLDHDWVERVAETNPAAPGAERRLAAAIRVTAMQRFAGVLRSALEQYAAANRGLLPVDISELSPLLPDRGDTPALERYEMLVNGAANTPAGQNYAIGLKTTAVVDPETDAVLYVGSANGILYANDMPLLEIAAGHARAAYANAHGGEAPPDVAAMLPYFKDAADGQRYLEAQQKTGAKAPAQLAGDRSR